MSPLSCLLVRLRNAMRPVDNPQHDRVLDAAVDQNIRAAQRGSRAAQALEEAASLVKDRAHAGRR